MDPLIVVLRVLHIVPGAIWVGMLLFNAFFLFPAIQESGPEGGKIMAGLQKRGLLTFIPTMAIVSMLAGLVLYWRVSGGFDAAYMGSRAGMAIGTGAVLSIVAFAIGMALVRASMMKAAGLMQAAATAAAADRDGMMAEASRLRSRAGSSGKLVAIMLILAATTMALARYL